MADTEYEGIRLPKGGSHSKSPVDGDADITVYDTVTEFLSELMSLKEGEVYVGLDSVYYTRPQVDWKKVRDISRNHLITEQLERLTSLLFIDRPEIEVLDGEGKRDEDVSLELQAMCDAKPVAVWKAMHQSWVDMLLWGPSIWNPVWKRDGNRVSLEALRRLPPESFGESPPGGMKIYSPILKGITLEEDLETPALYQTKSTTSKPEKLTNAVMLTDPVSTELAGTSKVVPLIPIVEGYNFCMKAQMQQVNRIGAPIVFVKITSPVVDANRDDIKYAQKILRNWGKDTSYLLLDNMELVGLNVTEGDTAMKVVEYCERRVRVYMSPATIIATEGPTLGEGTSAKLDIVGEFQRGTHNKLEGLWEVVLQLWLDHNGYTGLLVNIDYPVIEPDTSQLDLQRAATGHQTQSLTVNERRLLLGEKEFDLETEDGRAEMEAMREEYTSAQPASPFGAPMPSFGGGHGPPAGYPQPGRGPGSPAAEGEPQHTGFKQPDTLSPETRHDLEVAEQTAEKRVTDLVARAMVAAAEEAGQP